MTLIKKNENEKKMKGEFPPHPQRTMKTSALYPVTHLHIMRACPVCETLPCKDFLPKDESDAHLHSLPGVVGIFLERLSWRSTSIGRLIGTGNWYGVVGLLTRGSVYMVVDAVLGFG